MNKPIIQSSVTRRDFMKTSSLAIAGAMAAPYVLTTHAAADDPIRIGLIGCGGRGLGAVGNAIAGAGSNAKLVAIADLFPDRLQRGRDVLEKGSQGTANWAPGTETATTKLDIKLDDSMCFSGWDAYKKLLAVPEINYIILTTPPHFRAQQLKAAIEAGKNCFIEKPVATDPTGVRSILASGEEAKKKNLGILAGTQRRHQQNYVETIQRIHQGAIGKITSARAYWNQGLHEQTGDRKEGWSDMEWQLRNWVYFTWLAGDIIVEQHMHNIDVINWAMKAQLEADNKPVHPVKAYGMGGRQVRIDPKYGHIYDHFCVEFEYPDGTRMTSMCRQMEGCSDTIGEAVVGTKGNSNCMNSIVGENPFRYAKKFRNPYEQEHADFIASIRAGKPLNEAQAVAESNLAAIMGRESSYSGKSIDWDSAIESKLDLSPAKYELGALPTKPVAMPGSYKDWESSLKD